MGIRVWGFIRKDKGVARMTSLGTLIGFAVIGFVIVMLVVVLFILLKINRIKKKAMTERGENTNGKITKENRTDDIRGGGGERRNGEDRKTDIDEKRARELQESFQAIRDRTVDVERRKLPEQTNKGVKLHRVPTE